MSKEKVGSKIKEIVAAELECSTEEVDLEGKFAEVGLDSLMFLQVLALVEQEFDVRIPEEQQVRIFTLQHLVDHVVDARE